MDLFVIDTEGSKDLLNSKSSKASGKYFDGKARETTWKPLEEPEENFDNEDFAGIPPPSKDLSALISQTLSSSKAQQKKDKKYHGYENFAKSLGWDKETLPKPSRYKKKRIEFPELNLITGEVEDDISKKSIEKELKETDLKGLEKNKQLMNVSDKKLKDLRRIEKAKTKGGNWFNMPATEVTEEIENDLKILQMRSVLDPKHFYKKNDLKVLPKYFQIGTVQHSHLDYFNERGTKKNKKKSLVEELLADAEFQSFTKRKYNEVMKKNERVGYKKAVQKMKKLKKNKKK